MVPQRPALDRREENKRKRSAPCGFALLRIRTCLERPEEDLRPLALGGVVVRARDDLAEPNERRSVSLRVCSSASRRRHSRRSETVSLSHSELSCRRASAGSAASLIRPLCARMKAVKPSFRGVPDSAVSRVRWLLPLRLSRDLRTEAIAIVIVARLHFDRSWPLDVGGWLRPSRSVDGCEGGGLFDVRAARAASGG